MEIKLKTTQLQALTNIQIAKQSLNEEFTKLTQKEGEIVAIICEAYDVVIGGPVTFDPKTGVISVPETPEKVLDRHLEDIASPNK